MASQKLFLSGDYLSAEDGIGVLQNPRILCYDSPEGVCQKLHRSSLSAPDITSDIGSAESYDPSDRAVCSAGWTFLELLHVLGPTQN